MKVVDLGDDVGQGAAALLAARDGHDAERAAVAAAVLDLDEGAGARGGEGLPVVGGVGWGRWVGGEGRRRGRRDVIDKKIFLEVVEDERDAGEGFDLGAGEVRVTARDDELGGGVIAVEAADEVAGFAGGLGGDGAGVEHNRGGVGGGGGEGVARVGEEAGPLFEFGFVEAATERGEVDGHGVWVRV